MGLKPQKYKNLVEFKEKVIKKPIDNSVEVLYKKMQKMEVNKMIDYVHGLGLVVQPYTFKNDEPMFSNDPIWEFAKMRNLGVDGFFTDFCDSGLFGVKYANIFPK